MRTKREALRVPASTVIAIPGFRPRRVISRRTKGSRSDTLLITAGTPHAHLDNSTSWRARVSSRYAQALVYRGEYDRAGQVSRDALAAARSAGGPVSPVDALPAPPPAP